MVGYGLGDGSPCVVYAGALGGLLTADGGSWFASCYVVVRVDFGGSLTRMELLGDWNWISR